MRVIAGKFRSRQLGALRGLDIRPTSDRLRETLFNVLTAGNPDALAGSVWLDLFAGTGAVGIEALSRGAEKVYFVETSRRAVELIKRNLQSMGINNGFEILHEEVLHEIPKLERQRVKPNFIFLDPPYSSQNLYREALEQLANSVLSEHALVIVEHDKKFDPGAVFSAGALRRVRKLEQGDAGLSFYRCER